jgi:hypothetical protein
MSSEENVKQDNQQVRGDKGEVGVATAGDKIKQQWYAVAYRRVDPTEGEKGADKRKYVRIPGTPSLRVFARKLEKAGDEVAAEWFAHKKGSLNQTRTDANVKKAIESRTATHTTRRKKKGDNK